TTAVVAFGINSVKSFNDFDKEMRGVSSLLVGTDRTADQSFGNMSKAIRQLAVDLGVDAKGAATGLYETISAGVPAGKQAMDVLAVATKGAVAGFTEIETAIDGLTSILNAYK